MTPRRLTTPDRPAERRVLEVAGRLGLEATTVNSRHSVEGAIDSALELLRVEPRPSAVFCLSDSIACGVYAACETLGISIPDELSVTGYDDHPIARVVSPALTSVAWGMTDVAIHASDLITAALAGEGPPLGSGAQVRVAPRLIQRASSAPLPAAARSRG